jgi:hypothetical protein
MEGNELFRREMMQSPHVSRPNNFVRCIPPATNHFIPWGEFEQDGRVIALLFLYVWYLLTGAIY